MIAIFFSSNKLVYKLVVIALPEVGLEPFQPRLALLWCPGETLSGHLVGNDGENVAGSVHAS